MPANESVDQLWIEYFRVGDNWIAQLVGAEMFGAGPTQRTAYTNLLNAIANATRKNAVGSV